MTRVAITGLGALTAIGDGPLSFMQALCDGATGISGPPPWGGPPVAALPGRPFVRSSEMARHVAAQALEGGVVPDWVVAATTASDMAIGEEAWRKNHFGEPLEHPSDFLFPQLCHRPAEAVRRDFAPRARAVTVSTACTSGTVALGVARDAILCGRARSALVIGADALCLTTTWGFASLDVPSDSRARPFDADRDGTSLGEGAGAVLLEHPDAARARGATVLGWLHRVAVSADAHHLTAPDPEGRGAERAIRLALADLPASALGHVNAHGTGTPLNDAMEALALERVGGRPAISAIKGAIGHTLGAAGVIEAVATILALRQGRAPMTFGLERPISPIDLVRATRPIDARWGMSVNFAFGGSNAAALFERAD